MSLFSLILFPSLYIKRGLSLELYKKTFYPILGFFLVSEPTLKPKQPPPLSYNTSQTIASSIQHHPSLHHPHQPLSPHPTTPPGGYAEPPCHPKPLSATLLSLSHNLTSAWLEVSLFFLPFSHIAEHQRGYICSL